MSGDFSAVLLAGGKSSRMGRDKAALLLGGVPLWQRQLATLSATGAREVLVSGCGEGWDAGSFRFVADDWPQAGPLGGIATTLRACRFEWLLVLAVDMPRMTAACLKSFVDAACTTGKAAVPRHASGHWEPLAAIYPRAALPLAEALLSSGMRKMEAFVSGLQSSGQLHTVEIASEAAPLFENWNEPLDVTDCVSPKG